MRTLILLLFPIFCFSQNVESIFEDVAYEAMKQTCPNTGKNPTCSNSYRAKSYEYGNVDYCYYVLLEWVGKTHAFSYYQDFEVGGYLKIYNDGKYEFFEETVNRATRVARENNKMFNFGAATLAIVGTVAVLTDSGGEDDTDTDSDSEESNTYHETYSDADNSSTPYLYYETIEVDHGNYNSSGNNYEFDLFLKNKGHFCGGWIRHPTQSHYNKERWATMQINMCGKSYSYTISRYQLTDQNNNILASNNTNVYNCMMICLQDAINRLKEDYRK